MKSPELEKLIIKYITNSITATELGELSQWLEKPENGQIFNDHVKVNYAIDFSMSQFNTEKTRKQLIEKIRTDKSVFYKRKIRTILKYAAVFIGFMGIAYFFVYQNNTTEIQGDQLIIAEEDITLELENGDVKVINANGEEKIINTEGVVVGIQKGSTLDYSDESNIKKLVYNELTVPYGKIFDLVLSDGTKVKLNAGTSIKYPVKFISGKNRKVFLKGEAYFDVTKDGAHPFVVNANEINVRVLGTQFNVSSYPEDNNINTVLVEGSVSIYKKDDTYNANTASLLKPGHKAAWSKIQQHVSIEKVDTSMYTGWIDGKIVFDHLAFKDILKKLERHFDVSIINNNEKLNEEKFTASFDIETIEQVLNSFDKNYPLNFSIENNQIIIN